MLSEENFYKILVENQSELVSLATSTGRLIFVNIAYANHFGHTPKQMIGKNLLDFIVETDRDKVERLLLEVSASGVVSTSENRMLSIQGDRRWFSWTNKRVRLDGENTFAIHSVGRDITRKKGLEEAIQISSQEIEDLYDNAPCGYHSVDPDGKFCKINATELKWLGCSKDEVIGKFGPPDFCIPEDRDRLINTFRTAVRTGENQTVEVCIVSWNGLKRDVSITMSVIHDGDGRFLMTRSVMHDVTERKETETALRASQSFLARVGAVAGVGGWQLDLTSGTIAWSDQTCHLHGVPTGYVPSLDEAINFYEPESRALIQGAVEEGIRSGKPWDLTLRISAVGGRRFWARAVGAAEYEAGRVVRLIGTLQDIDQRVELERELSASHELLSVTLDSIGDAVITTNTDCIVEWLNPVAEELTGWKKEEARGRPLREVFNIQNEYTRATAIDPVAVCLADGKVVGLANHTILISRDGREYGIEDSASPIRNSEGLILGAVLVFHDVSEQRRLSNEMTYRATHDLLTDLANRSAFETKLSKLLSDHGLDYDTHALMFIDLDRFKLVNDACGHAVGDQLLVKVAAILQNNVRRNDLVARLGGDEFGIILENCHVEEAKTIGGKICNFLDEYRFIHDDKRFRIGASIGLIPIDGRWSDLPQLLQAADSACFRAKEQGRNQVCVWHDVDASVLVRQGEVGWASRLEHALDEDRFVLFGQRIVPTNPAIQHDKLHCEVLLRLTGEDGKIIAPGFFIPAAERFHLMSRIDRWVVRKTLELLSSDPGIQSRIGMISINLSGQSVGDISFHRDIIQSIKTSNIDLSKICFEITETAAISNLVEAKSFIELVRALGISVALDDFGSGSSSYGYLKSLPVDILKIDGKFIENLTGNALNYVAVKSFREAASVLGIQTVAEFVENDDVRGQLLKIGIDKVQGYLVHRPEELAGLLQKNR